MGHEVTRSGVQNGLGGAEMAKGAQEGIPVGIESGNGGVDAVVGVVVPALPVLGLVVDDTALHLQLADVQVPLEIGGVVHRVPQAPFHCAGEPEGAGRIGFIRQLHLLHFAVLVPGHQEGELGRDAVLFGFKNGVAHAMTAAVAVQRGIAGMEGGAPGGLARLLHIEEAAADVRGDIVVAVAQQTLELGVPVEAIAAGGIADQGEEILAAQIVDPGHGGRGGRDYVFFLCIVKKTVAHIDSPFSIKNVHFVFAHPSGKLLFGGHCPPNNNLPLST